MRKMLIVVTVLLGTVALAQQQPATSESNANAAANARGQTTIQGCLVGARTKPTLVTSNGIAYRLQGNAEALRDYDGRLVTVTGTPSMPANTSTYATKSRERTFDVSGVQGVSYSRTCLRGGHPKLGAGPGMVVSGK